MSLGCSNITVCSLRGKKQPNNFLPRSLPTSTHFYNWTERYEKKNTALLLCSSCHLKCLWLLPDTGQTPFFWSMEVAQDHCGAMQRSAANKRSEALMASNAERASNLSGLHTTSANKGPQQVRLGKLKSVECKPLRSLTLQAKLSAHNCPTVRRGLVTCLKDTLVEQACKPSFSSS